LRRSILLLCLLFTTLACAGAQPSSQAHCITIEDQGWLVHLGDNPAYADPHFDDSSWTLVNFSSENKLPTPLLVGGNRWFRKRITLPSTPGPLDLLLVGTAGSYEVFVDGHRIGPGLQSALLHRDLNETIYPVRTSADPAATEIEIALHSNLKTSDFQPFLNFSAAAIGDPVAIAVFAEAHRGMRLGKTIFSIGVTLASLLVGLLLVALYTQQRAHPEYFWLGLSVIFAALPTGATDAVVWGLSPLWLNAVIGDPSTYFWIAAQLQFVYTFIGRRPARFIRVYQGLLVLTPFLLNPIVWAGLVPPGTLEIIESLITVPGMLFTIVLLTIWYRRGSREAGILIAPMLLASLGPFVLNLEYAVQTAHPAFAFKTPVLGLVVFHLWSLFTIPFLLSIGFVIFQRFNRISREQAFAQSELESARSIQQVLIPKALPVIPHLRIASVYHPAQQVGGDFFQIIPLADSTLVAIGDVSGKGLPAAMNVALIVGTLRTLAETSTSPALILAGLNRRLLGRGIGFTTCLVLRILPTGVTTLANAGHLNPYLSGAELEVANGLPLGLTSEAEYTETILTLAPNQTLTLITDGVVEATDPATRAIFGFDRTRAICTQSAQSIASAAQSYGQEDDIAVLTLQYLAT